MKTLEKKKSAKSSLTKDLIIDNSLNNKTISKAELKKVTAAKEFLKKHPIPEHLLRK
jgi:hypothetical protein